MRPLNANPVSALRSLLFLLFQLVVTPLYASRCW